MHNDSISSRDPALGVPPESLEHQQVRLIYSQSPPGLLLTAFSIAAIMALMWKETPAWALLAWGGYATIVTVGRLLLVLLYRRYGGRLHENRFWKRNFLIGAALGGSVFGAAAGLVLVTPSLAHQVFLIFIIGGMAGGAIPTLSTVLMAYRSFAFMAMFPAVASMLYIGTDIHNTIGFMLAMYLIFLMSAARNLHNSIFRSLSLGFENSRLVQVLSDAKADAERINANLHDEIQQRQLAREALFQEKERAQITLESIGDGVITTDVHGHIDYMNPIAASLTGWTWSEARGRHLDEVLYLVDELTRRAIDNAFDLYLKADLKHPLPNETLLVHRHDRSEASIEVTASAIRDRSAAVSGLVLVFHDVTELRGLARQMSYQASHDGLTGLLNRREFDARLQAVLAATHQDGGHHALMYLDLDQFKVVNDTCGHLAGDELLKQLATLLQSCIRENDTLARLGGDEFGILLHGCQLDNARLIAEKLQSAVREFHFVWENRNFDIGVSIGLVPVTNNIRDFAELLRAADSACYAAKDEGRNRIHVYMPGDAIIAQRQGEMQWVHRLKDALMNDRFVLYYQPVVPVHSNSRHRAHCEILLRLRDEDGRLISPMTFIPAAERYHMMPQLDRWVVHTVLSCLGEGHPILQNYSVCAINLSGQSLGDDHFLDFVLDEIAASGVPPERICFEITETVAIANFKLATQFITRLRAMGCRFALDDFGSGLSSFGYLKSLEVDYLKIDGSFVKDIAHDKTDHAMVEAVNMIGHILGKLTIAEFVENDEILEKLRAIGVDYAQGYGIAKPQPVPLHAAPSARQQLA